MAQELNVARNTYVDIARDGSVRGLLHFNKPFDSAAATPQLVGADYLDNFSDLLGVEPAELANLGLAPGKVITEDGFEFRFLQEKQNQGVTTVVYQQTVLSLPIWEAGLTVQVQDKQGSRVLASQSSRHATEEPPVPPKAAALKKAQSLSEAELAARLGIAQTGTGKAAEREEAAIIRTLVIHDRELVVYLYTKEGRLRDVPSDIIIREPEPVGAAAVVAPSAPAPLPTLPLPPVPDSIEEGRHYVCVRYGFSLTLPRFGGRLNWVALVEVNTLAVLYVRPFVDDVTGLVFSVEPDTTNGGPGPTATTAQLNPVRVSKTLPGLDAPDAGGNQHLSGNIIALTDDETPTIAAPTSPSGNNFDYDSRTDNFAAVNAYYHTDAFFRLCEGMGFTLAGYFGGTTFPTPVDHRGHYGSTTGIEINAHCVGAAAGSGIDRTTFMLADLGDTTNPLGLACDYRVVLHELGGHGVLYNHVSSANFGFSHSAGDSVAAILNDPGTQADDRFKTFPWDYATIDRRHDRKPADGWGWAGSIALNPFDMSLDYGGYNNEQILSTSHFRLYRSIGGDASDLQTQQFASRMVVYLILKGVSTLSKLTNPGSASGWVTALQSADADDWISENITGGAYSKVIRWAFEKQGLFQSQGQATPNNLEGDPPSVDVYIDDGRGGEYPYTPVWWENQNIWNRLAADGATTHQDPVIGVTNYAYVKVKNRGTQQATGVVVKGYHANPSAGLSFPNDWLPMTTTQLSASNVAASNGAEVTVGPFQWVPFHLGHECMIMIVSATGDASNVDHIKPGDLIPDWRLVPNDNNIAQRNVAPVSGGGTSGVTAEFDGLSFELKNPLTETATMKVEATLPPLLLQRGWQLDFTNRGGASFLLQPQESRDVVMRMVPGQPFDATDVDGATDKTIRVVGYAGTILVGGLSYVLDPTKRPPHKKHPPDNECIRTAETLLDCLDLPDNVARVKIKKVTVDIEFDDC